MTDVKNVVPSFDEFSKDPDKYMSQLNQPTQETAGAEPAAQPGESDSLLGAQATAQPAQAPAAQTPAQAPAEGAQAGAEQGGTAGAGAQGAAGTEGPEAGAEGEKPQGQSLV